MGYSNPCMTLKPQTATSTTNSVKIKSKTDPEALLNDLSTSLKSFSSTVRTWTSAENFDTRSHSSSTSSNNVEMNMRPARLGLGAKPVKSVVGGEGVSANLTLKKQLTSSSSKVTKPEVTGRFSKLKEVEEEGGRASMISKNKNPYNNKNSYNK